MFSLASCGTSPPAFIAGAPGTRTNAPCVSVMLFYDIAITFGDEVERIWKQRFTGATVLWFLVRNRIPLRPPTSLSDPTLEPLPVPPRLHSHYSLCVLTRTAPDASSPLGDELLTFASALQPSTILHGPRPPATVMSSTQRSSRSSPQLLSDVRHILLPSSREV